MTSKRAGGLPFTRPVRRQHHSRAVSPQQQNHQKESLAQRGGGLVAAKPKPLYIGQVPIERNPNYVPPSCRGSMSGSSSNRAAAVTEPQETQQEYKNVEQSTVVYNSDNKNENNYITATTTSSMSTAVDYRAGSVPSWGEKSNSSVAASFIEDFRNQFLSFYRSHPSLAVVMAACAAVFMAWQVQPQSNLLNGFFVLSRANVRAFRWPCLFLSTVSHFNFLHLLVNLLGLWNFGPEVQRILQQWSRQPLGPFLGGAALASSAAFLLLQKYSGAGGSLGLSGVTLALLAVFARTYPSKTLGMRLAGVIPIRMKAESFLIVMTLWSFVGSFARIQSNVGHAAHLGGLLFGIAYHQLFLSQHRAQQQPAWGFM